MGVIDDFVKLEGGGEEEVKVLKALWSDKITSISLKDLSPIETVESERLKFYLYRGGMGALLHKPTGLFLLLYALTAVEIESIKYMVEKGKDPDNVFISVAYEFINVKGKGRLGKES